MASPIDLVTNVQWSNVTYAGVVGKSSSPTLNPGLLVFPQAFHNTVAGRGSSPFIHPVGFKEWEPAAFFSKQDFSDLNVEVQFTLIGKFSLEHPKMDLVRNYFDSLKFRGVWKLGLFDGRHLLIQLTNEEDYARVFAKQSIIIVGAEMKILKWNPEFDPSKEPPVVPIWFKIPGLPLHLFKLNALFNIGCTLGTPLKVDAATYNKARPASAKILIERDITLPETKRIWIGDNENGFWQEVAMEQRPYYCQHCKMFGHTRERCYRLNPPNKRTKSKLPQEQTTEKTQQQGHQSVEPEETYAAPSIQNTPKEIPKVIPSTEKRKNRSEELPMEKETSGAEATHTSYILKPNMGTTVDIPSASALLPHQTDSSDEE